LTAESRLKEVESHEGGAMALDLSARVNQLEEENESVAREARRRRGANETDARPCEIPAPQAQTGG
jgi:hypothetical protein